MSRAARSVPGTALDKRKRPARKSGTLSPRERVVNDVLRGLYDGRFEPGQRLIEAQLTEDYGISRGPVREALNRLAAMGVIELAPRRGARVRILTLEEAINSLIVAQALVGVSARLAAERRNAKDLQRLQEAVQAITSFDEGSATAEYSIARDAFYAALAALADNDALTRVVAQVHIHLIRIQFRSILHSVDRRRHRDYLEIANAVAAGNAKEAERTGRAHIGRSITALQAFLSNDRSYARAP